MTENNSAIAIIKPEDIGPGDLLYRPEQCDPVGLVLAKRSLVQRVMANVLIKDVDYGIIPGTNKAALLKPGAEKLISTFALSLSLEKDPGSVEDWESGFFFYRYKATICDRQGNRIAVSEGCCNSKESKYRYRWVSKKFATPEQIAFAIAEKKDSNGYLIIRIENNEPFNMQHTVSRMAQKRAITGAAAMACCASDMFDIPSPDQEQSLEGEIIEPDRPKATDRVISSKQISRLIAIAKQAGYADEARDAMIAQQGFTSKANITVSAYEGICSTAGDEDLAKQWNEHVSKVAK